jgi:L-ascorbate metabolism protein UlaG (beta-lactamase superfamily)
MDHFNYGSLDMLPKHGKLLIPFGGAAYTPEFGFAETREMKAWDALDEDGVRITAVPVQHFGGRYGFDVSWYPDRGYTGWVIEYKGKTVFIAGDTGYHPEYFKEIGRRFAVDVAIVPIGPTGSGGATGVGGRVHVSPRGAVQIFEDVQAKMMIPMHYRTFFQGSQQSPTFAQDLLRQVIEEKGYGDRIRILDIGEQQVFSEE